ncbi:MULTISPECIES: calcium-binding protein [unclassified Rhizobium]|uniref:calcium-binding protein n=1 Tax=unclassified Rhizobium TaxID=2613769 RepID=UPI000A201D10|nr:MULTISPECIES: calcium-binding protein [unclassified Rhizobium]ARO30643.1 serralysin-like metalloprotease domain-containing protein [Rhizobium sp. NXC14]MDK4736166.1 calcium-binding protein [Rhizobium sp. CNPSo 3490]
MALNILNTNGATVTKTGAEFEAYDVIRYSAANPHAKVSLVVSGSGAADLADELGSVSAEVTGSNSDNAITTGAGNDIIRGYSGNDQLNGGDGDDQISGGAGNDVLRGGAGNDTIGDGDAGVAAGVVYDIDAGDGDDTVVVGNDFYGFANSGIIDGGAGIDKLHASDLTGITIQNFEILESQIDIIATAAQFESFDKITYSEMPGGENLAVTLKLADDDHADLSDELGSRSAYISGIGSSIDVKTAGGNDVLIGTDGNDILDSGTGEDGINAGAGNDIIKSGAGNDTIIDGESYGYGEVFDIDAGSGNDIVTLTVYGSGIAFSGTIDGGADTDSLNAGSLVGLTVKNFEILETFEGNLLSGGVLGSAAQFDSFEQIILSRGSVFEDMIISLRLADSAHADLSDELATRSVSISGTAFGIDVKTGGGDDVFTGTGGNDTFDGSAGTDTAIFYGNFANYSFAPDNGAHILTSEQEGTDTLRDIEFARFADGLYDFATETFTRNNSAPTNIQLSKTALSEDTPIWTTVGLLSAKDADGDTLTYTLLDGAGDHFRLKGNRIITSKALDYETDQSHTIRVAVSDGTVTVEKDITINVLDVNEAPVNQAPIKLSFSRSSISENVAIGTSVGLLSAVDPEGGTVKWRLTDDADGIFKLVGNKIQTKAAIDYESTHSLTFTAEAYDAAGNITSHDFTLAVKDIFEPSSLLHDALI